MRREDVRRRNGWWGGGADHSSDTLSLRLTQQVMATDDDVCVDLRRAFRRPKRFEQTVALPIRWFDLRDFRGAAIVLSVSARHSPGLWRTEIVLSTFWFFIAINLHVNCSRSLEECQKPKTQCCTLSVQLLSELQIIRIETDYRLRTMF